MRRIEIEAGLTIRFPNRSREFDDGVEIGLLASSLGAKPSFATVLVSLRNIEQSCALAGKMGYQLSHQIEEGELTRLEFRRGKRTPSVALVSSQSCKALDRRGDRAGPQPPLARRFALVPQS